jgi:hypothetical protein
MPRPGSSHHAVSRVPSKAGHPAPARQPERCRDANEVVGRFWGFGIAIAFIGALLSVTTLDSETSTPFALGLLLLGIGQTIVFVAVIATGVKWGTAAARA